jgi:hypothetical protein
MHNILNKEKCEYLSRSRFKHFNCKVKNQKFYFYPLTVNKITCISIIITYVIAYLINYLN